MRGLDNRQNKFFQSRFRKRRNQSIQYKKSKRQGKLDRRENK